MSLGLVLVLIVHGVNTFALLVRITTAVFAVFEAFKLCLVTFKICSIVQHYSVQGLFLGLLLLSLI